MSREFLESIVNQVNQELKREGVSIALKREVILSGKINRVKLELKSEPILPESLILKVEKRFSKKEPVEFLVEVAYAEMLKLVLKSAILPK